MPAPKTTLRTEIFNELNAKTAAAGENNDCAVKAIAIVTGASYDEVLALCTKHGRQARKATPWTTMRKVIDELGFHIYVKSQKPIIQSYPGVHKNLSNVTTHHPARFPKAWEGMGPVMLFSNGHVSAFRDGKVHDWAVGRSLRIQAIWEIVKKGEE